MLGIKEVSTHNKADMGSVVHKALELLAWQKKGEQEGILTYRDPELKMDFSLPDVTPDLVLDVAYDHYKNASHLTWKDSNYEDCKTWLKDTLEYNNGLYDPRKRHVISPEVFFDFTIDEPWAKYEYQDPFTGESFKGTLAIKGTIDLVTLVNDNTIEYLDWKTGRRYSWSKDCVKTPSLLYKDFQLLLYHYALCRLYPQYENIFVTIFFCRDGGPFPICFDTHHNKTFLKMLQASFEKIQNTKIPERIITDPEKNGKCFSFCGYHKSKWENTQDSVCKHIHKEIVSLGVDRVIKKYGHKNAYASYGSGGGQSNREV